MLLKMASSRPIRDKVGLIVGKRGVEFGFSSLKASEMMQRADGEREIVIMNVGANWGMKGC